MSETKVCGKCGFKNAPSNNFCEQCGAKLSAPNQGEKGPVKSTPPIKNTKSGPEPEPRDSREKTPTSSGSTRGSFSFPWMEIAYAVLLLITIYTRFDHLGNKPHHHDESMHSFYSWQLFKDGDYHYDPMMHGPFQFHGNALMYYLFGVSNATSRYLAAFFGLLTVVLAIFLGPFLGRWGAFLATTMLVFSPSFMYFDRFTREDAYIAGGTFLMVVFLFRYFRSRLPMDLWLAAVGFSIAYCTKESIFLTIAVIGTYIFIRLLPWVDVLIAGGLTGVGVASQLILKNQGMDESSRIWFFFIPVAVAFGYTVFQLITRWQTNLKKGKPESEWWEVICGLEIEKIQTSLLLFIGWWIVTAVIMGAFPKWGINFPSAFSFLWVLVYFGFIFWFCWLWLKNVVPALTGSIAIFGIFFTLLFTTFFTVEATQPDIWSRMHGLLNALYMGAFGGLQYWWEQHGVARGGEPWFYYLLQLPANELVSFFFSLVAMAYYLVVPVLLRIRVFFSPSLKPNLSNSKFYSWKTIPIFLSYWYVGSLALFSWAGEKMPWLILHPLLPSLLLSAYFMGQVIQTKPVEQVWKGARLAALMLFALLMTYSLHSAVLLSFYHESNPVESLVYVQSGPDCQEVERIVREISYGETGGPNANAPLGVTDAEKAMHDGLPLTIEDKCSWPFAWQLRDFARRNHPSSITMADNPIIMTGTESDAQSYPILSAAGYVNRKYQLRIWWVPSWYKKGFPASDITWDTFWPCLWGNFLPIMPWWYPPKPDMVDWGDIRNWYLYRQVWSDLGSYNMRLWVRKDLADRYGFTETTRSDIPTDYPKPEPTPQPTPDKGKKSHKH